MEMPKPKIGIQSEMVNTDRLKMHVLFSGKQEDERSHRRSDRRLRRPPPRNPEDHVRSRPLRENQGRVARIPVREGRLSKRCPKEAGALSSPDRLSKTLSA